MWSTFRPAALRAARVHGATSSLPARHGLGCLSARVVLNRSASCAYRLTVVARSMATAVAKTKTARKPAAAATKAKETKPKGRAAVAKKVATKTTKSAKATKTTKSSRAAKPKAKSKAAKPKKKAAKARKPAKTPEEKLALDKRKLAKQTLSVPTQLPATSWLVYLTQKTQGKPHNVSQDTPALSKSFKELSTTEIENLKDIARANAAANKVTYKAWVESHTPAEVQAANKARSRLRRVHQVSTPKIRDPRLPKRPMTPFLYYIQKGFTPRDPAQESVTDHAKSAASQWNTLPATERKPFVDMAIADQSRYVVEKKNIGLS
ncbi:hypothetical protein RB595_009770 [Gaeumannomyces hyphopodioides]